MAQMIPLTKGFVAVVDDEDFERVSQYKWQGHRGTKSKDFYARNSTAGYMHRFVLDAGPNVYVDHINGDSLDNRRANLRLCTNAQNQANRTSKNTNNASGFRGVYWEKGRQKWRARIGYQHRTIVLGHFSDPEDAARAYDAKALELFGEFARPNFPQAVTQ